MCSLINKQLLLTAYAYLFIMEQQKDQQGSEALELEMNKSKDDDSDDDDGFCGARAGGHLLCGSTVSPLQKPRTSLLVQKIPNYICEIGKEVQLQGTVKNSQEKKFQETNDSEPRDAPNNQNLLQNHLLNAQATVQKTTVQQIVQKTNQTGQGSNRKIDDQQPHAQQQRGSQGVKVAGQLYSWIMRQQDWDVTKAGDSLMRGGRYAVQMGDGYKPLLLSFLMSEADGGTFQAFEGTFPSDLKSRLEKCFKGKGNKRIADYDDLVKACKASAEAKRSANLKAHETYKV